MISTLIKKKAFIFVQQISKCEFFLNEGTTIKGAIDDVDLVIRTLEECGLTNDRFYIHCDAALLGLIVPFLKRVSPIPFNIIFYI